MSYKTLHQSRPSQIFESIGAGRGFEKVVTNLRAKIIHGDLAIGQRLPSEHELASQLGVSRSMLREALKALEVAGYLEVQRGYGGGRFVATQAPEEFRPITSGSISPMDIDIRHVMEVRLAVEPICARLSAQTNSSKDLLLALHRFEAAGNRPARTVEALVQFALALAETSGNPVFVGLYEGLTGSIAMALGRKVHDVNWCKAAHAYLVELIQLIEDGKSDGAERTVRRYLTKIENIYCEGNEA